MIEITVTIEQVGVGIRLRLNSPGNTEATEEEAKVALAVREIVTEAAQMIATGRMGAINISKSKFPCPVCKTEIVRPS